MPGNPKEERAKLIEALEAMVETHKKPQDSPGTDNTLQIAVNWVSEWLPGPAATPKTSTIISHIDDAVLRRFSRCASELKSATQISQIENALSDLFQLLEAIFQQQGIGDTDTLANFLQTSPKAGTSKEDGFTIINPLETVSFELENTIQEKLILAFRWEGILGNTIEIERVTKALSADLITEEKTYSAQKETSTTKEKSSASPARLIATVGLFAAASCLTVKALNAGQENGHTGPMPR